MRSTITTKRALRSYRTLQLSAERLYRGRARCASPALPILGHLLGCWVKAVAEVSLMGRCWMQMAQVNSCLAWPPPLQGFIQAMRMPTKPQELVDTRAECLHAPMQQYQTVSKAEGMSVSNRIRVQRVWFLMHGTGDVAALMLTLNLLLQPLVVLLGALYVW